MVPDTKSVIRMLIVNEITTWNVTICNVFMLQSLEKTYVRLHQIVSFTLNVKIKHVFLFREMSVIAVQRMVIVTKQTSGLPVAEVSAPSLQEAVEVHVILCRIAKLQITWSVKITHVFQNLVEV